jgi:hypothetical protein
MPSDSFSSSLGGKPAVNKNLPPVRPPAEFPALAGFESFEVPFSAGGGADIGSEALGLPPPPLEKAALEVPAAGPVYPSAAPPAAEAPVLAAAWEAILEAEFLDKDRNGDGFLSMKEISIKELLELDVDHNGFISIDEFFAVFIQKSETAFQKMDLDRDGRLKLVEFAKGAGTAEQHAHYARYAGNAEAGLSLDEYRNFLSEQRGKKR